jgi:hypothetical protein
MEEFIMLRSTVIRSLRFLIGVLLLVVIIPASPLLAANMFSDDFESYSSFPQGNWMNATGNGSWAISQISTQLAKQTNTSATNYIMTNGQASWTNYTYQARIQAGSTGSTTGILGRYADNNNYYMFALNNGNVVLKKKVRGTTTTLQSAPYSFNSSTFYTLQLSMNGSTISGSVNGVALVSATDSSLSSGKIALYSTGAGWWDDVVVSDTSTGGTSIAIVNPGFEDSFNGWTTSGRTAISTSDYHGGTHSGKIQSAGSQISQTVSGLSPNTGYTLSAWILGQGEIGANSYGGSEVTINGNASNWTPISVNFTTGLSNTSAVIFARGTTSSDVRFDDFTLTGTNGSGGGGDDTQAPTTPANLTATAVSSSQIELSWNASTDNVGVTGYDVYRGTTLVGSPVSTTFSDTGLTASTTYSYSVKAKDAAGNSSVASNTASATTLSSATPTLPSQVLYLKNWKLTLPIPQDTDPTKPKEVLQPELDTYSIDPWFVVAHDADGYAVQFRANHGSVSTSGSKNPRSELREMVDNYSGSDSSNLMSWGTNDGKTHTMFIKQKVTHLTIVKPQTVVGQIHDASDDVTVFRVEGNNPGGVSTTAKVYITDGDNTHAYLLDSNYVLGTVFTVKVTASNGVISYEYNGQPVPYTQHKDVSGCYFKIGNYTQSNDSTAPGESPDAYAENWVYAYSVTHQ